MATDTQDIVLDSEEFSRWVFQPRYIDELGILNSKFVTLRYIVFSARITLI